MTSCTLSKHYINDLHHKLYEYYQKTTEKGDPWSHREGFISLLSINSNLNSSGAMYKLALVAGREKDTSKKRSLSAKLTSCHWTVVHIAGWMLRSPLTETNLKSQLCQASWKARMSSTRWKYPPDEETKDYTHWKRVKLDKNFLSVPLWNTGCFIHNHSV